jgi:hypothetical protein
MAADTDPTDRRSRLEDTVWERHSNPKSGWSRLLIGPLIALAVYRRDWRLLGVALIATIVNPVAFSPPDSDTDSWMTRAVRAERWWLREDNGTLGVDWPNVLNTLNLPAFSYALVSAYRRRPVRTTLALALSMALKLGWIEVIARRYDESAAASDGVAERVREQAMTESTG